MSATNDNQAVRSIVESEVTRDLKAQLGRANALCRIRFERIRELEAQLEAIGAGGVGPLMQSAKSNHVEQHLGMVAMPRAVVEQPQGDQEPVAYWIPKADQFCVAKPGERPFAKQWEPLHTHPQPPRKPLTDQVIQELADEGVFRANVFEIVRRIEEEHGIFKLRAIENGGDA